MNKSNNKDVRFKELQSEITKLDAVRLDSTNKVEQQNARAALIPLRAEMAGFVYAAELARARIGFLIGFFTSGFVVTGLTTAVVNCL